MSNIKKIVANDIDLSKLEFRSYVRRMPSGRKCCAVKDCFKNARSRGDLCIKHGGGIRCSAPGCTRGARSTAGLCIKHGGGPRCLSNGCDKGAADRCEGYCVKHYNICVNPTSNKREREEEEDDDSSYKEDNEFTNSTIKNNQKKVITIKSKKHRVSYISESSKNSIGTDIFSSTESDQQAIDDAQGVFAVEESETDNKSVMAKSILSSTSSSASLLIVEQNKMENADSATKAKNLVNTQAMFHSPKMNPTSSSSSSSPDIAHQFQTAVKQNGSINFVQYNPAMTTHSQPTYQRMYQHQMFNGYVAAPIATPAPKMLMVNPAFPNCGLVGNITNVGFMNVADTQRAHVPVPIPYDMNYFAANPMYVPQARSYAYGPMMMKQF